MMVTRITMFIPSVVPRVIAISSGSQFDGAIAFGHVGFDIRALGCDYYGTSLHKFLGAPRS
jgi:hypothetical protein